MRDIIGFVIIPLILFFITASVVWGYEDEEGRSADDLEMYLNDQHRAAEQRAIVREMQWEQRTRDNNSSTIITNFPADDGESSTTIIQELGGSNSSTICHRIGETVICQ